MLDKEAVQLAKIAAAIPVVVRDLAALAPGAALAAVRDDKAATNGLTVSWRGNSGWCAVEVDYDAPLAHVLVHIAGCLQESETLFYEYFRPWPVCPLHGLDGGHSLTPEVRGSVAWWSCSSGGPMARIGELLPQAEPGPDACCQ